MSATAKLDSLVDTYSIDTVTEHYKRLEFIAKLSAHINLSSARVMELGAATGDLTALLAEACLEVVAVDGSQRFIELARQRPENRRVEFVHSLFESLQRDDRFDLLVMHHVLEHVEEPIKLLSQLRKFLCGNGVIAITVPNANALSRQLAVKMGLLESVYALTENDHRHGHYRVYDWQSLEREIVLAGFDVIERHGLALKLFADFQNEQAVAAGIIGDAQLRGLWLLAEEFRQVAGAMMVVARSHSALQSKAG